MEQERAGKNVFLLRNHDPQLVYLPDKNLNCSVFCVRNLIGDSNVI